MYFHDPVRLTRVEVLLTATGGTPWARSGGPRSAGPARRGAGARARSPGAAGKGPREPRVVLGRLIGIEQDAPSRLEPRRDVHRLYQSGVEDDEVVGGQDLAAQQGRSVGDAQERGDRRPGGAR